MSVRARGKLALLRLGGRSSEKTIHYLNGLLDYFELGWWLRKRGFHGGVVTQTCREVFETMAREVGIQAALYLQFGAEDPGLVERWAALIPHPDAALRVFGFDNDRSGTWLPARGLGHTWEVGSNGPNGRERLRMLAERDQRVRYETGRPSDLLSAYEWPSADVVVAVFDTDHYASAKAGLDALAEQLPIGSYLFFDQLNHRADELRAFHEYLLDSGARFELFARNSEFSCVAFRRVG
jgi:hypothetical protein